MNDLDISKAYAKLIIIKKYTNRFKINNEDLEILEQGIYELFTYIPSGDWVYEYNSQKENILTLLSYDLDQIENLFCNFPPWHDIELALRKMDYKSKFIENYNYN